MGAVTGETVTRTGLECGHDETVVRGTRNVFPEVCHGCAALKLEAAAEAAARAAGFASAEDAFGQCFREWAHGVTERIRSEGRKRADLDKVARGFNHQNAHRDTRKASGSH